MYQTLRFRFEHNCLASLLLQNHKYLSLIHFGLSNNSYNVFTIHHTKHLRTLEKLIICFFVFFFASWRILKDSSPFEVLEYFFLIIMNTEVIYLKSWQWKRLDFCSMLLFLSCLNFFNLYFRSSWTVSYTHLTLPTIYSV